MGKYNQGEEPRAEKEVWVTPVGGRGGRAMKGNIERMALHLPAKHEALPLQSHLSRVLAASYGRIRG